MARNSQLTIFHLPSKEISCIIQISFFSGVQTRFPWILPILTPDYVTDKMIHAILHNQVNYRADLPPRTRPNHLRIEVGTMPLHAAPWRMMTVKSNLHREIDSGFSFLLLPFIFALALKLESFRK